MIAGMVDVWTHHWFMLGRVLVYVFAAVCHPPLVAMDAEHDGAGCRRRCRARTWTGIGTITVKQLIRLTTSHPIKTCFIKYTLSHSLPFPNPTIMTTSSQFHQIKAGKVNRTPTQVFASAGQSYLRIEVNSCSAEPLMSLKSIFTTTTVAFPAFMTALICTPYLSTYLLASILWNWVMFT